MSKIEQKDVGETNSVNFTELLQMTTLHGARFLTEKSAFRKLFWAFCLLGAAGACGLQLKESVAYFMSRPFSTVIATKEENTIEFPAVTICNLNSVHTGKYSKMVKERFPDITDEEIEQYLSTVSTSINLINGVHMDGNHFNQSRATRLIFTLQNLTSIAHEIEDILLPKEMLPCKLAGKLCGVEHFEKIPVAKYIQCFTFKPFESGIDVVTNAFGLRLKMNIGADWYLPKFYEPFVGLKVLVHPQDVLPSVDAGFLLEPGTHTACAVRRKELINLRKPYETDCGSTDMKFLNKKNLSYSRVTCIEDCYFQSLAVLCKCKTLEMSGELPLCVNKADVICMSTLSRKLSKLDSYLDCAANCRESCNYSVYETKLSTAKLNPKAMVSFTDRFCMNNHYNATICQEIRNRTKAEKIQYVRDNIVSLNIYLEDIYYDEIKQVPAYGWVELMSDLGGNLGLFLGMSVLTLAEYIDYVIRILWYKLRMIGKAFFASKQ